MPTCDRSSSRHFILPWVDCESYKRCEMQRNLRRCKPTVLGYTHSTLPFRARSWKYKLVFESFLSLLTISDVGNDILWMGLRVKNNRGQWWRRWLRGNEGRTLQLGSSEGLFYVSNYCLYYWIMRNQPQEALVREHFMHKRQKKCTGIETETNMKRLMDRIIFQYYWNLLSWRNSSEKELMERRWIIPGSPGVPGKEPGFYYIYDRGALIHFKQVSKINCFTFLKSNFGYFRNKP